MTEAPRRGTVLQPHPRAKHQHSPRDGSCFGGHAVTRVQPTAPHTRCLQGPQQHPPGATARGALPGEHRWPRAHGELQLAPRCALLGFPRGHAGLRANPNRILGPSSGIARTSKLVEKQRGRTWLFIKTRFSGGLCWRFMGKVRKSTETLGKPEFGVIMKCETQPLSCGLGFLLQNILCSSFRRERAGRAQRNASAGARDSHTARHRSGD